MNAIVLVVDQLHAGHLGCYGNSWIGTPGMDRLASQGFLFDQALLESPRLNDFYDACWRGRSTLGPPNATSATLPTILREQQLQAALVSDYDEIFATPAGRDWEQTILVEHPQTPRRAESQHDCQFARVFAAATEWLAKAHEPFVLWTHFRGLGGAWDAPLEFRGRYFEEEDLDIPDFVDPPRMRLADNADPDELLAIRWSYAAQVSLFDACLAEFLELIDTPELLANTAVMLMSPRGYPLGEHRSVGFADPSPALHAELIHLPWLLRMPGQQAAAMRSQALVQPADVHATLLELLDLPQPTQPAAGSSLLPLVQGEVESLRDHVLLASGGDEQAIRTPAWHLRLGLASDGTRSRQLFVKPDDRWEINEVADRCGDIAEALARTLTAELEQAARGEPSSLQPLDDSLVQGMP